MLAVLNVPVYWGLGRLMFKDWEGVQSAVRYWFTPDLWSAARGRGLEDAWAELKIVWYVLLCAATVLSEYAWLLQWFPSPSFQG